MNFFVPLPRLCDNIKLHQGITRFIHILNAPVKELRHDIIQILKPYFTTVVLCTETDDTVVIFTVMLYLKDRHNKMPCGYDTKVNIAKALNTDSAHVLGWRVEYLDDVIDKVQYM